MLRLPLALTAAATLALALPMAAHAAPKRAPLGPQLTGYQVTLHPSGKDRFVEHGGSGTQGKAASDPDGMYNYGVDQFGRTGGLYLFDQDGNNGCGNDQDFEDDNNGNCGRQKLTIACPSGTTTATITTIPLHGKHVIISTICTPIDSSSPSSGGSGSGSGSGDSSFDFYSPVS